MGTSMQHADAFAWHMERDPTLRSTIIGIAWLEESPDWERLVANLDRATRAIPAFRQVVVDSPGTLTPRWTTDDHFDLTCHLRRMDSPAPHTPVTVIEFARNAVMTAFDHARPLWEFTLIEQLSDGRAALVMKIHHALTDGIGGMQLALELFDLESAPGEPKVTNAAAPPAPSDAREPELEGLDGNGERVGGLAVRAVRSAVPTARRVTRRVMSDVGRAVETARSISRTLAPVSETLSPIMTERGIARHLDLLDVDLADLKGAAATAGGSLNDAFMAAVTGGLRRYHERHGAPVADLRVTLPISIRRPGDAPGGNHITLIRFAVPVSDSDPASRIRAMGSLCRTARQERSLRYTGAIAATVNLLPRRAIAKMLKHIDFVATDIPGFASPIYLAGARVQRYVAFGPTVGTAVNVALLSYDGVCCVGASIDTAAVTDPGVLIDCLREGFEEVLALGGAHQPVRLPLRVDAGVVAPSEACTISSQPVAS